MASSDRLTRLRNIRNQLQQELEDETLRRATLVAAGNPAPVTYQVGAKTFHWTEYVTAQLKAIRDIDDYLIAAGGDDGGIPEASLLMW